MSVPYYDWLAHHAMRSPDKLAAVDLQSGRRFSYADYDRRTGSLAAFLGHNLGLEPGERVAVLAPNCTEYFEIQFACARVGAIFLPLNWRLTVPEAEFIIGDAAPKLLIHDAEFAATATELKRRCSIAHLLEIGSPKDGAYEQALAAAKGQVTPAAVTHDDVWTIMYTSGTTGLPKGAMITYGMTFYNAVNLGIPAYIGPDTVHLAVLPLFHTGGLNCYANPVLHAGGTVLVMRTFDPAAALKLIDDKAPGITHFFGVPANYQFMAAQAAFATADLSRLKIAGVGGAPISLSLLQTWQARGVALQQGYGMTETSPSVLILGQADAARKAGSTGLPVLHNAVRIVDENGKDAAQGAIGELWVKGPNVTPGYWNRPEATASSFTDGWLHTGDAARIDEDGFYYIVDRWKDMYISGGENVYPAEVENVIYQLPAVAEAAVFGMPDEKWGEIGYAAIVVKPGHALSDADVLAHCRERLARFKLPRSVVFVSALPRNATGKVLKRELRDRLATGRAAQ